MKTATAGPLIEAFYLDITGQLALPLRLTFIFLSFTLFSGIEPISDSAHVPGIIDDALNRLEELQSGQILDKDGKDIKLDHYDICFDHVRRLTIKSQGRGRRKKSPPNREDRGAGESGNTTFVFLSIKNDVAKVMDERIDIFAEEAQKDDECKRAAKTVSALKIRVRTGIHHEMFGKLGLSEMSVFARLCKALGKVVAEGVFTDVLHEKCLAFVKICAKYILKITKEKAVYHEAHTRIRKFSTSFHPP